MKFVLLLLWNQLAFANNTNYEPQGPCPQKLSYKSYSLCYHPKFRLALWAYHELSPQDTRGGARRTNDYRPDPRAHLAVGNNDYKGSGYDRGHLVPAADRKQSKDQMSETFFMTNMTPQHPSFNRGVWQSLERYVRKQVQRNGPAIIITAPHLYDGLPHFRKNIVLPENHYKIIFWPKLKKAYAFLLPNESANGRSYRSFQVTIDEIEELTGLDFFTQLEDQLEEKIEGQLMVLE